MTTSIPLRSSHRSQHRPGRLPVRGPRPIPFTDAVDVSIVATIFDEVETIEELYDQVATTMKDHRWEMILVDDGSTDGSVEKESGLHDRDARVSVVRLRRNFGKTAALSAGISIARGNTIVTIDADLQDDPTEIPRLLDRLNAGCDMVSGWRRDRKDTLTKRISSRLFNGLVSTATGVHLHDMNCGLKAFRAEVSSSLKLYGELHRYLPVLAHQKGYRVAEIPVRHRPRTHGSSKYGWERALAALLDTQTVLFLTRYLSQPLRLFGTAGLALLAVGLGVGLYLSALHFTGVSISQRPLLFLSVLLTLSGVQLVSTGLIAEMLHNITFDPREEYSVESILHRDMPDSD